MKSIMKSNLKNDTISFLLFFMAIFYQATLFGQVNYTTGPNNSQINNTLQGTGLTISGGTLLNGNRNLQIATYSNGIGAGLDAANGVYFSTGNAAIDLNQKNQWPYTSNAPAGGTTYNDPDLTAINPDARFDALVYSFSVTLHPSTTALRIRYQFGSEEYPDWVGTPYDDTFGFFVSGPGIVGKFNMARLPNGNPTRINTVNSGTRGYQVTYNNNYYVNNPPSPLDFSQGAMYINNGHTTALDGQGFYLENTNPQPGPFPVFVEFNAITKLITYDLKNLTPSATYTFKIAIADASDEQRDCGVFIDEIKGVNGADVFITKTMNNMTPPIGSTVQFTLTAGNFGPYDATNTNVNDLLPSGYTYVSHVATQGTYNAVSGVWSLGTLIKNTNPTLVINATVNPSGSYTNTATISAVDPDPDLSNNTSWVAPLCPNPPQVPNYSVKQPTCSATYGTISVSNPPNGMEYSLNNGVYQQNASFTNLTPGSYVLCARSQGNPSCPIACTGTITINAIPSTPVTPQYTVTQPTCAVNSGSVAITSSTTGLEISLDGGAYVSTTTFNGLSSGSHT
ncbi:choice-of-anchor L domain-containing protein, partial [Flavobacterium sp.]|uniref:choice-of-anchor L domain-containing protein n=1 Tax=Flavobacterium sp. TaxID=239 RepID=UPI0040475555